MPTTRIGDVHLYYEMAGIGPPVLFISGTGGDLRQRPGVHEGPLAKACTVLAYDQRGLGRSSKPDRTATMADYADDAAVVIRAVDWKRCRVVGVSFGGMVAQELAIRHPEVVECLVLCCTSSGGEAGASYPLHELRELPDDERRRTTLALSDVRYDRAWQAAHPDEADALLALLREREEAAGDDADPDADIGARRQLEARAGHDCCDRLDRITAPTLVCAGRFDGIAPLANSEGLAAHIPNARLEVYDGGHLFLLQDRQAWRDIVAFVTSPA